ncbi:cytochrome P450 6k1-like [Diabrotica virgifera virgifera]|uniref:Cytochrome P450 6k1-like n=1 Tax=Diabrotica virgifera virgifera TaxID=50390 RepID=A0ABM5KLU2_DIAVI|nr:cytochrome P450 6k1-like [Diabrotica virgifera virgifera]XP_050511163.1 cytochrome P450 6k1-like [Diabrotica virgifera virgifera]
MLLSSSITLDVIIILITSIFTIYLYISRKQKYFQEKGVYTPKIQPIFGHFFKVALMKISFSEWLKYYYDTINKPFFGLYVFDEPMFVIKDAQLVKKILIKDFNYFTDRNVAAPDHSPLTQNIMFFQKSPAWKNDRAKTSVAFTSGRLRGMFPVVQNTMKELEKFVNENKTIVDAKEVAALFSTDLIAQCAFGIQSYCFDKAPSIFRAHGRKCFEFSVRNAFAQMMYFFKPDWAANLKLEFLPKDSMDYFSAAILKTMKSRQDTHTFNDIIDIINDLKNKKQLSQDDENLIVGIPIQFLLAGYETTSTTISFTLYEFAKNVEIQNKVRAEIKNKLKQYGGITYEAVHDLPYLDMCIFETLRRYPVLPFLDRRCNTDYSIPNSNVVIDKGTAVLIPIYGLHLDKDIFPDPYTYNPERFREKFDNSIGSFFVPFGDGPRRCAGERFGLISTKTAIITVLLNSEVTVTDKTPAVIKIEPKCFLLNSADPLFLNFRDISD